MDKQTIIDSLTRFARQRPGLEFGNYGDVASYRSELRGITRDLAHARVLLRAVELAGGLDVETLKGGFRAYSGRLTLNADGTLDYCKGQYWPTEYRRAVCAVCASALWDYYREGWTNVAEMYGKRPGDFMREQFRRMFGRAIANRWFD